MPAASAAAAVPRIVPLLAICSERSAGWPSRRSSKYRPRKMIPKLIPLPMTIDDRNALAMLRCPMVSSVNAKVTSAPTVSDQPSASTPASERK